MMTDDKGSSRKERMARAEGLLRATASYGGAEIEAARGGIKRQLEALRGQRAGDRLLSAACCNPAARTVDRCLREYPWQAIGIVAVAALAAGACLARRPRR
ncbi:glycine zipper domain-containing protein [Pollutimonas bauzanensis]|uniref:Membrane-anchored ribosome-binding protein, inhibits growth in stationary phase, ElaB/YqjD/DUF883 family n=1 Tax=Pollutimonas bauzanensis TaxID=658167 RepID=A0A1M5WDW6_9BURK|nr:DUF883 family protein [Pollutimonas bauzanensis]SHH85705.1 Membrane-anchored ribosome-binding protein, inhibits growth in stationary phase, ElaB/YqjD/DUF883 family [Pollutimonas bauzanensis]